MAAAPQQQFVDFIGLANKPVPPNAVQWSADGVLAVAAAHSVVLLSPADLQGPRAFASPGNLCDPTVLQAPGDPADPTADAVHEVAHLRVASMVSQYPALQAPLSVRSLGWSPAGCAQGAGCLLAAVTNDHQVGRWVGKPAAVHGWEYRQEHGVGRSASALQRRIGQLGRVLIANEPCHCQPHLSLKIPASCSCRACFPLP